MNCRSISLIRYIFLAAVIANVYSEPYSSTGTDLREKANHLETNNPKSTAEKSLGALLDVGDNAMVIVAAGDTHLLTHRAVLAARSPVFAAELEANCSYITITGVEGPVLRQLLALLYTPEQPLQPVMSPQLQAAADKFGVSVLKPECWQQAAIPLSVETAAATAVVAIRHSCASLRQAAIAFIKVHIPQVIASQGWADVVYKWHKEVIEVTRLLFDVPADNSTPSTADSRTSPTSQPQSHHTDHSQTPNTAAPTMTCHLCTPSDIVISSALARLSAEEKTSRLMVAAKRGAVWKVAALLSAGADVEARDGKNRTALHWAAIYGQVEAARCLLGAGADVGARDRWLTTPLHRAARYGHTEVMRLLLEASADPDARDENGWTPLHDAAYGGQKEAAVLLLKAGADRGAISNSGETPLDVARRYNEQQIVDLLS